MRVISQDGALATLALISDEVKPLKGFHLPGLLRAIAERYAVAKAPTLDEARATGAKFENGVFRKGDREIPVTMLGVFNDALSVTTTDTDDSDLVLNDLYAWLKSEFQFRDPITPSLRLYQSDLIVKFDNDPAGAFESLRSFIQYIQEQMTPANAWTKKDVQFSGIVFGTDATRPGPSPEFTIARRINTPWRLGLYFSKAHMPTSAHIHALELLDELVGSGKKRAT